MLASRQIVNAIVAALVAAGTTAAGRVYGSRAWPIAQFPAVRVVAGDEALDTADEDITWPRQRTHTLQVDVHCVVQQAADPESAADALAVQVLQALEGSLTAATLAPLPGVALAATRLARQAQADGEATTVETVITFEVLFGTASNDPTTLI
jgi:hypothetical protein